MPMKGNNQIVNAHFKKQWQTRVKSFFNQPAAKKARRVTRQKVRCPSAAVAAVLTPVSHLLLRCA